MLAEVYRQTQEACLKVYNFPQYRLEAEAAEILSTASVAPVGALFHVVVNPKP